jgi:hypothetical protein
VKATYPTDHAGVKTGRIELLDDVKNLKDYPLVVVLTAGTTGIQWWLMYAKERIGLNMGGGCTGDAAMQVYPFLQSGQLCGLIPGIKGAAEYETLLEDPALNEPGISTRRMVPQTMGHLIIILFVLIGNVAYVAQRRKGTQESNEG